MSGIAGIIHFDGAPAAPGLVEAMTRAMAHRGPDGIDHWVQGSVALGQCMLRTTPESLEERQPLPNEDASLVLVMDGRVDNWEQLRRELLARGAVLRTRADAELVLRAYEAWGRDCLPRIEGDFALVIWDARRREAFCARDRIGNKPFHYHWDGRTFAFASDLHAILALPWVREVLNEGMLAEFLANEWHSRDETFWQGVLRLVAAHRMTVDALGPCTEQYWEPDLWATLPCTSEHEYVELYRELFTGLVRRMSRSSRPLACEVSGGLDSSAIFAVAERLRRDGRLLSPTLQGYTLAFADDSDANELEFARAVGAHLGIAIHEIPPSRKLLSWYRERASSHRVFPSYPNGVMGLGIRRDAASRGCRALLVGVGGDEWLCGSRSYYADALATHDWKSLVACMAEDRRDAGFRRSLYWLLRHGCFPLLPDVAKRLLRSVRDRRGTNDVGERVWLTPRLQHVMQQRREEFAAAGTKRTRYAGQRNQASLLVSAYAASARELEEGLAADVGIELRRPFFSHPMVQFAFAAPERYRLRGTTDKHLHRQALTGLLPESVRTRRTKADFMVTFRWHRAEIDEAFSRHRDHAGADWVDGDQLARLHARFGDPRCAGAPEWLLWTLFGCEAVASSAGSAS